MELYDKEDEEEILEEENGEDEDEIEVVRQAPASKTPGRSKSKGKKRMEEPESEPTYDVETSQSKKKKKGEKAQKIRDTMGVLGKLHNNVISIRASGNRTTWFRNRAGQIIPLDNRTRWNSWFLMLMIALLPDVKNSLQSYAEEYPDNLSQDDTLTIENWRELRKIYDFLRVFYDATKYLEGSRTTLERVLFSIDGLASLIQTAKVSRTIFYTILLNYLLRKKQSNRRTSLCFPEYFVWRQSFKSMRKSLLNLHTTQQHKSSILSVVRDTSKILTLARFLLSEVRGSLPYESFG